MELFVIFLSNFLAFSEQNLERPGAERRAAVHNGYTG